jgi:predicted Zn-dependent protease
MGTTTVITTGIGSSDQIVNNDGGKLNDTNLAAQLAAASAALGPVTTPGGSLAASTTSLAAFGLALNVLEADDQAGKPITDIGADYLTLFGDAVLFTGSIVGYIPGGSGPATVTEYVGDAVTLAGVGIRNWDAVLTNTPIAFNELVTETKENIDNMLNTLSYDFIGATGAVSSAWDSTETAFSNAFNSVTTTLADFGTSAFNSAVVGSYNAIATLGSSFTSLFNSTGATPQNVTDTVTNNSFVITSGSAPNTSGTATIATDGSTTGLATTGNSGNVNFNENESINSTSVNDTAQNNNPSGTNQYTQATTTQSSGQVNSTISGQGDNADLSYDSIAIAAGVQAAINGVNNAVTVAANAALTIGGATNTTTVTGTGTTVTDNGASDSITLQGNSSSTTMNGTGAVATSTGSSDNVIATGASASVTETGGGDSVTTYGTGSAVNASGTGDGVVFEGNSETATLTGAQDNINFYGTSDSDTSSGASSTGNVYGSSDNFINIGNNSVATVSGNGDSVTTYGTGSTVSESGTGDGVVFEGNTQTATLTGSQDNVYAHGTGDSATSSGGSDTGTAYGNTDNLIFTGTNSVAAASGSGDSITAWGSGSTINETGNGDGAVLEGASQSVSLGGANETATTHATSDNVNMSSTGDAAVLMGTNDSGTLTGTSDTNSYATDTTTLSGESVDITAKDTSTGGITFTDVASGSGSGDYNFSGSSTLSGVANDTLLDTGSYSLDNANLSSGGSIDSFFGFNNNIIETAANYTGANASGELTTAAVGLTDGVNVDDLFSYNGSGAETGFQEDWYDGSSFIAYANFNASGSYINGDDGGALAGDGGFGDGGEFELATGSSGSSGKNIANFSQFDSTLPNNQTAVGQAQVASAEINSLMQAAASGNTSADQALYEGAKWGSKVITWSLADSAGPTDSPFSSYMGTQYQSLVGEALNAWGAASGLTFKEVSDSGKSDIRIGWGDFDTSSSGVVGYTTYQTQNGQLQPDAIVRLEDPLQNPLQTTSSGTLQYSGTSDSVYEVLLHELGHALGLADNNDPNSVMYYQAGASSTSLDSNDTRGMETLYGSLQPSAAMTQLIQSASSTVVRTKRSDRSRARRPVNGAARSIRFAPVLAVSLRFTTVTCRLFAPGCLALCGSESTGDSFARGQRRPEAACPPVL